MMLGSEQHARAFFLLSRLNTCSRTSTRAWNRNRIPQRRFATQSETPQKSFYVTSPIFYVNAAPHVGHLYTLVLTDVLKRWRVLCGDQGAKMLTGTDEHGMKIQKAAQKAETDVKVFCDTHMKQFQHLSQRANISYDHFIRTTDEVHKAAVEHFWTELNHRGFIYEAKHEGWYSVSDETFFPQSAVHLVRDPASGRKHMASMETGREVEWTSETNYHFPLSKFQDKLLKHYEENPDFIQPSSYMNFIKSEVRAGLQDLSISRPVSRLQWGIPVPGDESQTIYVWLDALINYLTYTGYPFPPGSGPNSLWPPNVQVIGKDILKFHCIYWPAFLMAIDIPLPKTFLCHAFWTMNREKMSKSVGNVVNPFFAIDRFDVDTLRYYLVHEGGLDKDADYENFYIIEKYKNQLQGAFGNLVSRVVRGKKWSIRESVSQTEQAMSNEKSDHNQTNILRQAVEALPGAVSSKMDGLNSREAVRCIMEVVYQANRYLQQTAIWDLVQDPSPNAQAEVHRVLFTVSETIRICAILMQPIMPTKMKLCLDMLGVDEAKRTFEYAQFAKDFTYGKSFIEIGRGTEGTLFPPLVAEW